jgi:hypothetical protein
LIDRVEGCYKIHSRPSTGSRIRVDSRRVARRGAFDDRPPAARANTTGKT